MKKTILLLIICLCYQFGYAQIISGSIFDGQSKTKIPYANIVFKDASDKIKFATSGDTLGNYKMELTKGLYTVYVSYQGYQTITKKIDVRANYNLDFNLIPDQKLLNEVVIVDDKTTIEQKIDKK